MRGDFCILPSSCPAPGSHWLRPCFSIRWQRSLPAPSSVPISCTTKLLCYPITQSPNFDDIHYKHVTNSVRIWYNDDDDGEYLTHNFSTNEVIDGMKALKKGKAAGCDGLTTAEPGPRVYILC